MDVEVLSRIQFAYTIAFHYIFPPLSIGVGLLMVIMETCFIRTGNKDYEVLARFWTKIFGLIFGIGVATGIVMEFEFGTNWATYSRYVGDIFGSALAAEGLFAFALESGFLGILLFGWNRVKPWVHWVGTFGVFFGSLFSAIWIVVANSWQQTPAGFKIVGAGVTERAEITNFWEMVFNPSSVDRLTHVWFGAFLAGAFLMMSVHAYYIYKGRFVTLSKKAFVLSMNVALVVSIAQLASGHSSAIGVTNNQPAKLAALEGHYNTNGPADAYLLGWVDEEEQTVSGLKIPGGLSFMIHQDFTASVPGLNAFPQDEVPGQVNAVFQFYHIMVILGMSMIGLMLLALFFRLKGTLFEQRWLMGIFIFAVLAPNIANQLGWFAAEMGRQPWIVYGLLKTSDALSKSVDANQVVFSLILFALIYTLLFVLFIYLLNKKIKHGPYSDLDDNTRPLTSEITDYLTGNTK